MVCVIKAKKIVVGIAKILKIVPLIAVLNYAHILPAKQILNINASGKKGSDAMKWHVRET
jgi:hypothetical protein